MKPVALLVFSLGPIHYYKLVPTRDIILNLHNEFSGACYFKYLSGEKATAQPSPVSTYSEKGGGGIVMVSRISRPSTPGRRTDLSVMRLSLTSRTRNFG